MGHCVVYGGLLLAAFTQYVRQVDLRLQRACPQLLRKATSLGRFLNFEPF